MIQKIGPTRSAKKPLNNGHLQIFKNMSAIEWCPLFGGNFKRF